MLARADKMPRTLLIDIEPCYNFEEVLMQPVPASGVTGLTGACLSLILIVPEPEEGEMYAKVSAAQAIPGLSEGASTHSHCGINGLASKSFKVALRNIYVKVAVQGGPEGKPCHVSLSTPPSVPTRTDSFARCRCPQAWT